MGNLSAAIIRPQLSELPRRVRDGLRNHDRLAAQLTASPYIDVPTPLAGEQRAPDSIQFNLTNLDDDTMRSFASIAQSNGVKVQIFGQSQDNARAFWNWQFLPDLPDLPQTRAMLMRACDVRLPVHLTLAECDTIAEILLNALQSATKQRAA